MSRTRRPSAWLAAAVAGLVVVLGGCTPASRSADSAGSAGSGRTTVRIAAAADLKFALDDVSKELAASRPDLILSITYGSSGTFFQQLSNGAPFDLFLSADLAYPRRLVEAGLADEQDLFRYAVGRLVVWAPTGSPVDASAGLSALADPQARKVAIANPDHAPYGVAAVAAMKSAGVYDVVAPKLVLGENVAQAAEFALSGNAQAGVFALSLALAPEFRDRGSYAEVPVDSYPRIEQGGVVMSRAADPAAARAVRGHLLGQQGRAILKKYGFFLDEG